MTTMLQERTELHARAQGIAEAQHGIRNSLGLALGWAHILRSEFTGCEDPLITKAVATIAERLEQVHEQFVGLVGRSRELLDAIDLAGLVSVNDLLHEIAAETEALYLDTRVQVTATERIYTRMNELALREALDHLIANACMHGEARTIRMLIEVAAGETYLHIDNDGLPLPTDLDILEAGVTTGGTGFGLSVVQSHLAAFGGELTAQNLLSGGVRMTCRLPRA